MACAHSTSSVISTPQLAFVAGSDVVEPVCDTILNDGGAARLYFESNVARSEVMFGSP
jgi:hypothetical protein